MTSESRVIVPVRWVTWYPTPYWDIRFQHLARRSDLALDVVYLSKSSLEHEWQTSTQAQYKTDFVTRSPSALGYERHSLKPEGLPRILRGARDKCLVMPYGSPTLVLTAALAKVFRIPYLLFVPNTKLERRRNLFHQELAKRAVMSMASGFLVPGAMQEAYVRRYASPRIPLTQLGNPVDTARLRSEADLLTRHRERLRERNGWTNHFVVGYVGRLTSDKDIPTLLRAAAKAYDSGVPIVVAIAGSGPEEKRIREEATYSGIRVDMKGFLEGKDLSSFYAALDVFVLPSLTEAWGLVVNEAMEFGLPVLVSDRVGARSLVTPGETGYWFPARDTSSLARALQELAKDPHKRRALGERGKDGIATHTVAAWVDKAGDTIRRVWLSRFATAAG